MWEKLFKDYFSFSKKERVAVIVLVVLIALVFGLPYLLADGGDVSLEKLEIKEISAPLARLDTTAAFLKRNQNNEENLADQRYKANYLPTRAAIEAPAKRELFYFDPNKTPVEDWRRLGLREKTINTIRNYLSKGGIFRSKADLKKIYGLSADDAERLMPYLSIENGALPRNPGKPPAVTERLIRENSYSDFKPRPKPAIIDVNLADTGQLVALPGIGTKLADRIVLFREKLGGFYAIDQLSEIYGLPDSTFQKLKPIFKLDSPRLKQFDINTAGIDELKAHPYIRWKIASAIIAYRGQHGRFTNLDELKNIVLVTNELYIKIVPYLKIE